MNKILETILERVDTWPEKAQAELARSAVEIEKKHVAVYRLSDEERAGVEKGLAAEERGEIVSDEDMTAFFKRHGL